MFKHILIPTDGSELSERAAKEGVALAKVLEAKITGIHVIPLSFSAYVGFYGEIPWVDMELQERLRQAGRAEGNKYLDRMQKMAQAAGVKFEHVLLESDQIWKGIVDTAEERRCDLIMMATHGRRGLSALVLGSETQKVLTHSKIPVLAYR